MFGILKLGREEEERFGGRASAGVYQKAAWDEG